MAMTPGLSPSIRHMPEEPPAGLASLEDILVEIEQGHDKPETDDQGNILRIEHDDGSVSVSLDGRPVESAMGDGVKRVLPAEVPIAAKLRRVCA